MRGMKWPRRGYRHRKVPSKSVPVMYSSLDEVTSFAARVFKLAQQLLVSPRYLIGLFSSRPGRDRGLATLPGPFMVCSQFQLIQGCFGFQALGHLAEDLALATIHHGPDLDAC